MLRIFTSRHFAPEKTWVLQVLAGEILGLEYALEWDETESGYRFVLPNRAELKIEDHFFRKIAHPADYSPRLIPAQANDVQHPFESGNLVSVFGNGHFSLSGHSAECGLDIIADTFFMLSRWEESVSPVRDEHGRFPAAESLAFRSGFFSRPVVHEWADFLKCLFERLGWKVPAVQRAPRLELSCDVDHPRLWWSPAARLKTLSGALFSRKNGKEVNYLINNQLFSSSDPYDVFDEWFRIFENAGIRAQFNFLGKRPRSSDCWYPLEHPFVKDLMKKISRHGHRIGFHASYESVGRQDIFEQELQSLEAVAGQKTRAGRQHYLRFSVPQTWRQWAAAGLQTDSTLGYPEAPGFRCGICLDFPVFDLEQRQILPLRELPLIAMDVTLAHYQKWQPRQALEHLEALKQSVLQHRGIFTLLWHNSSWNSHFWRPWQPVFLDFIQGWVRDSR